MTAIVTLIGNAGRAAEARGPAVGWSVATSMWRSGASETTWWDVSAFGEVGERALKLVQKGSLLIVTGRAYEDSWTDKKSGETHKRMRVVADSVTYGPATKRDAVRTEQPSGNFGFDDQSPSKQAPVFPEYAPVGAEGEDEIPF